MTRLIYTHVYNLKIETPPFVYYSYLFPCRSREITLNILTSERLPFRSYLINDTLNCQGRKMDLSYPSLSFDSIHRGL